MDVKELFIKYISFGTASDEQSSSCPSTDSQKTLAKELCSDLALLGAVNTYVDDFGYVYGTVLGTNEKKEQSSLGLIAHMDTSPDVQGNNVNPHTVIYNGGDIELNSNIFLREADFECLKKYNGSELIVTDGKTLLGADDKAGIAEIFAACAYLVKNPQISHRPIKICITPDEEIGRGADNFNLKGFNAQCAYTVDGGALGEIEYENFNAATAVINIKGVNIHPGYAKNKMKNAALLAADFVSLLPKSETPTHTEGYEGFYHVCDITANESEAKIKIIIRDHNKNVFEKRKQFICDTAEYMNKVYGGGTFTAKITDSYYNMKEKILPHFELIKNAQTAMKKAGVEPVIVPIRGGTDGARLSFDGLPCPNLCTGGENFHSICEFIPTSALYKMTEVIINLVQM